MVNVYNSYRSKFYQTNHKNSLYYTLFIAHLSREIVCSNFSKIIFKKIIIVKQHTQKGELKEL